MAYVPTYKNIERAMQPILQDLSADIVNSSAQSELKAADLQPKPIVIPAAITQTHSTGSEMMDSLASAKTLVGSESYQRAQSGFQSGFQSHSFNSQTIKTR